MKYFFWRFKSDKISIAIFCMLSYAALSMAEEIPVITIKEHRFSPQELGISAGKKIKILDYCIEAKGNSGVLNINQARLVPK